jgi:hypothetical protein
MCPIVDVAAIYPSFHSYAKTSGSLIVSVIALPAIIVSISCDILHQLLVPIYNRSALQIVYGELIAADRTACHIFRNESL